MKNHKDEISRQLSSTGDGKLRVSAEARRIGNDLLIAIWGGTRPHIGAVSVSVPRPSLADSSKTGSTSSVINLPGHKDEAVARMFSEKLAARFSTHCIATAGIHIDHITENEITAVMDNCAELCQIIIQKLERPLS